MAFDAHSNLAYSTVLSPPSPPASGTSLTLAAGGGALMPAVPFNALVWPVGLLPVVGNAEIVRVTNVAGDVLTITRTQESTSARTILAGDQFCNVISAKVFTDIETAVNGKQAAITGAKGDLIALSAVNTVGNIADVAVGRILISGGVNTLPVWSASPWAATALGIGAAPIAGNVLSISAALTASSGVGAVVNLFSTLTANANGNTLEMMAIGGTWAKSTFTNLLCYSLFLGNPTVTGAGTILTQYGIYIAQPTNGATNYALYAAGGLVAVADITDSSSNTTGALTVSGGLGVVKNFNLGGTGNFNSLTDSTSTGTGSIVCLGGLGVSKTSYLGGDVYVGGTVVTGNATRNLEVYGGTTTGQTAQITLGQDATHSLHILWSANSTPGNATAVIGTHGSNNPLTISASALTLTGPTSFSTTTDASSTTVASVMLAGGLAVAKTAWVGGNITLSVAAGTGVGLLLNSSSLRWAVSRRADSESGSNAGSSFGIFAYDDTGANIDQPINIVRAAGGAMLVSRPFATSADVDVRLTAGASAVLSLGRNPTGNFASAVRFLASSTQTNWQISHNAYAVGVLEFTPSTAGGGSSFTTPVATLSANGNLTINSNGANTPIFSLNNTGAGGRVWQLVSCGTSGLTPGGLVVFDGTGGASIASFITTGLAVTLGFGCNGKAPQSPVASGGVLANVVAALIANGILSS